MTGSFHHRRLSILLSRFGAPFAPRTFEPATRRSRESPTHERGRVARFSRFPPGLRCRCPIGLSTVWGQGRSTVPQPCAGYRIGTLSWGCAKAGKEPRTHARTRGCNAHTHAHAHAHTRIMHARARAREGTPSHYVDRVVVANSISIKNNRCVEFE